MRWIIVGILVVFLIFVVRQLWYFYVEAQAAESRLRQLNAKLEEIRRDRESLQSEYEFYLQPANLEKELRLRFNYRLPGEKMIIIVPSPTSTPGSAN